MIGCSSEAASCEEPACAAVPAACRDAGVRVAVVTAAGTLSAVKLARMLPEVVVGQYSSFEQHAEDLLGQLDSCRWSENAERERA